MAKKPKRIGKVLDWKVIAIGKGAGLGSLIAWLFFQSVWGLLCIPVCVGLLPAITPERFCSVDELLQ